jgi:hypothetical protein
LRIKKFVLVGKKVWQPAQIDIKLDYCQFARGADNPLINTFVPGFKKSIGSALQECPYEVCICSYNV